MPGVNLQILEAGRSGEVSGSGLQENFLVSRFVQVGGAKKLEPQVLICRAYRLSKDDRAAHLDLTVPTLLPRAVEVLNR